MNMAYNRYQEQEFEYLNEDQKSERGEKAVNSRRPQYTKRSRPVVYNGIHRRRNKRFAW